MQFHELTLVNYCHPDCEPMQNIVRLPKAEAFALAKRMAEAHPDTTSFGRFADFDNYYALRMTQDAYLHQSFLALGGKPQETHPLSFVLEGSDYLKHWFADGIETRLPLRCVAPEHISFTMGDSGALYQRQGFVELLTVEDLRLLLKRNNGDLQGILRELHRTKGCAYIEAQLWSDEALKECIRT